jgi:hypothetical protein
MAVLTLTPSHPRRDLPRRAAGLDPVPPVPSPWGSALIAAPVMINSVIIENWRRVRAGRPSFPWFAPWEIPAWRQSVARWEHSQRILDAVHEHAILYPLNRPTGGTETSTS